MSCESCIDEAKERMRDYDNIKDKAKKHAAQTKQAMAICKEGTSGAYFVVGAVKALAEGCIVCEIVSGL